MKLEKDFGTGPNGVVWFEYRATIEGEVYAIRATSSQLEQLHGLPIERIWLDMRSKLMRKIEERLFNERT